MSNNDENVANTQRSDKVHIVHFDSDRKIKTIRLYWDQGSLLKLVDVIGSRARNWPIRDGKDQARLIVSSVAAAQRKGAATSEAGNGVHNQDEAAALSKPVLSRNVTGDPHASLSLFTPRDVNQETSHFSEMVAPRASAKPPPRDYNDLFGDNETNASPSTKVNASSPTKENRGLKGQSAKPPPRDYHDLFVGHESDASPISKAKQSSPLKENNVMTPGTIASKGGAGKNYQPSRLFETDDSQSGTSGTSKQSPDKHLKSQMKQYSHFNFDDSNEHTDKGNSVPAHLQTRHQSQWGFEDFMTPQKVQQKIRDHDVRHFGWSDDEPNMESPVKQPRVVEPRPDAQTHFEFQDDGTPAGERRPAGHPRGQGAGRGMDLYLNNLVDDSDRSAGPERKSYPLSTVTNLKDRHKQFDPHFSMTDASPAHSSSNGSNHAVSELRSKAVKMMDAQWEATDRSPGQTPPVRKVGTHAPGESSFTDQENYAGAGNRIPGIKTGGDGMGGTKGMGRTWGFGSESDEDGEGGANSGKPRPGKKQQAPKDSDFWDL